MRERMHQLADMANMHWVATFTVLGANCKIWLNRRWRNGNPGRMKQNTQLLCTLLVTALRRPIVQVSQRKIALFIYLRPYNEPAAATELIPAQVKILLTGQR